jgi:hypothetical protein
MYKNLAILLKYAHITHNTLHITHMEGGSTWTSASDSTRVSLNEFYRKNHDGATAFTDAFLGGRNLLVVQRMLTLSMAHKVENPSLPVVEFTESLLSALMQFAHTYRLAYSNADVLTFANRSFVDQMMPSMEARYRETAFWKRWCAQGIPDPNNIPLPLAADTTDYTVETDSYTLGDPWGNPRPMW